jgi:hypothetical protein
MMRKLFVAMALLVAAAPVAMAGTRKADASRRAGHEDAGRLMKEAVRTGTADAAAFAAIAEWILYEKEEKVAAGLADVLGAAEPTLAGAGGERWHGTTRAMFALFTSVLRDAASDRRRSADGPDPEIDALVAAAMPAVAAAIGEAIACEAPKTIPRE